MSSEVKMKVTTPAMLSAAMRDKRKQSKLTQAQTAKQVGIKQTTVSDFENKPESTKLETLFKILASLDLELHIVKRGSTLNEGKAWSKEW
nr:MULTISPECIES: helix-turn-helix domain-containing protein [Proteus]